MMTPPNNLQMLMIDNLTVLIGKAIEASRRAYAPYSNYAVGAVLRSTDGQLFTGCNVENASYPVSICAERGALMKAISEGHQTFDLLIVASQDGGTPCGMCRQMLSEFSVEMRVVVVAIDGKVTLDVPLSDLLPHNFTAESLR